MLTSSRVIKRILDISFALAAILCAAPVLLLTALMVRLSMGRPVLFRQRRPGLHGRPFDLLKFRSMNDRRDGAGRLLPDEERLTALGKLLRMTSLDELPQLWNVLRGDMSLIGPRPLLMGYLARYSAEQRRRHEVKPGITGWAQINGRNELDWEERLALDVWYVDHQSLLLDLRILWRTLFAVALRRGIARSGHATMPEFLGRAHRAEPGEELTKQEAVYE